MTNTSITIFEMQKFHFGSKILCTDGEEGILSQVGFDPTTRRMTHISIRQGRFFGKNVYLPYDTVTDATGDGVTLRVVGADVLTASKNAPDGSIFLDMKSVVEAGNGKGTVSIIAVHPESGELAYIVTHHLRAGQDTLIGQEYVSKFEPDHIVVTIPEATLQALPAYRSDSDLQQEVERTLFDLTALHIDYKGMTIRVLDGILYLSGNISSSLRSDVVQDQASGVQGLLGIKNQLLGDDTLAADIAAALGRDERTRDLPIGVYPKLGIVRLGGAVHTPQQKMAAEDIARSFPGTHSVVNTLVVNANADLIHVMSPAEGGEADDLIPGKYIRHTK